MILLFIKTYVNDSFLVAEGNEIAIYTRKNGFRVLNDDTTLIIDTILIKVEKNNKQHKNEKRGGMVLPPLSFPRAVQLID